MKRFVRPLLTTTALLLLFGARASAQNVIVLDLDSSADLRDTAGAISMLVRSQLAPGQRRLVADADLVLALKLLGNPVRADNSLDPGVAERVMERLGADRLFTGVLTQVGGRLSVRGQVAGVTGGRLGRVSVDAPAGEIARLSAEIIKRLASRLGLTPAITLPDATMTAMRPLVSAAGALVQEDVAQAARQLALADRTKAAKLRAVAPIAEAVIKHDKSTTSDRVLAALTAGETERALQLAKQAIEETPDDVSAQVARVRALTVSGQLDIAEQALSQLGAGDELVELAALELSMKPGSRRRPQDDGMSRLLAGPETALPTLAFVSTTPPKAFSPKVETAVVAAAERMQPRAPGLASAIGVRAVHGRVEVSRALRLVLLQDQNGASLLALQKDIEGTQAASEPSGVRLAAELVSREMAERELQQSQLGSAGGASPELIAELSDMLKSLPPLGEGRIRRVMVAPFWGSGAAIWSPITVKTDPVRAGLRIALLTMKVTPPPADAVPPRDGGTDGAGAAAVRPLDGGAAAATTTTTGASGSTPAPASVEPMVLADPPPNKELDRSMATAAAMADMADEGDVEGVVFYRVRARFAVVRLELVLFDRDEGKTYEVSRLLTHKELRAWQTAPLSVAAVLLVFLLTVLIWRVSRMLGGNLLVVLEQDPGAEDEMLTIVIDQSQKPPKITSPAEYKAEMNRVGETQSKLRATCAGKKTVFPHLKKGSYYVHLYGIYTRAGRLRVLDDFTARVDINPRHTATVLFKLQATLVEFHISVTDGDDAQPVAGALVWVDEDRAQGMVTPPEGAVVIQVPKGQHVINMEARGIKASKNLSVLNTKPQKIAFNLVWERRVEKASRALEGVAGVRAAPTKTEQRQDGPAWQGAQPDDMPSLSLGGPADAPSLPLGAPAGAANSPSLKLGGPQGQAQKRAPGNQPRPAHGSPVTAPSRPGAGPAAQTAPAGNANDVPSLALATPDDVPSLALTGSGEPGDAPTLGALGDGPSLALGGHDDAPSLSLAGPADAPSLPAGGPAAEMPALGSLGDDAPALPLASVPRQAGTQARPARPAGHSLAPMAPAGEQPAAHRVAAAAPARNAEGSIPLDRPAAGRPPATGRAGAAAPVARQNAPVPLDPDSVASIPLAGPARPNAGNRPPGTMAASRPVPPGNKR